MSAIEPSLFPFRDLLGFTIEGADGGPVVALNLTDSHMNPNGVAHGATSFALLDTAMGAAVMAEIGEGLRCATIEIQTRFHRSARDGRLVAQASILNAGRRVIHLEAKVHDGEGNLVASATGSFAVIEPPATTSPS